MASRARLERICPLSKPEWPKTGAAEVVDQTLPKKLMARFGLTVADFDVNEAFASQGLATPRELGIAFAVSGVRIIGTAALEP